MNQYPDHGFDISDLVSSLCLSAPPGENPNPGVVHAILQNPDLSSSSFRNSDGTLDFSRALRFAAEEGDGLNLGQQNTVAWSSGLAKSHLRCFDLTGDVSHLQLAITNYEELLALQENDPDTTTEAAITQKVVAMNDLATCYWLRFRKLGNELDLQLAIDYNQKSMNLQLEGEEGVMFRTFSNLSLCLRERFGRKGDVEDLHYAINYGQLAAPELTADDPVRWEVMNNLAACFQMKANLTEDLADVQIAEHYTTQALATLSGNDNRRRWSLLGLGETLRIRFEQTGERADIDKAIEYVDKALKLVPVSHPERQTVLSSLALCLQRRFQGFGDVEDIKRSISIFEQRIKVTPQDDPLRALCLTCLADGLTSRALFNRVRLNEKTDNKERLQIEITVDKAKALELLEDATNHEKSFLIHRLRAAEQWRKVAYEFDDESDLSAHVITLRLLDTMVERSRSLETQSSQLGGDPTLQAATGVASAAAAIALSRGDPRLAVSLLETGRVIMFRQLGRLRTRLDEVREVHPQLAERFASLSGELEELAVTARYTKYAAGLVQLENDPTKHHKALTEWSKVVAEIRALPGFDSFLCPLPYDRLQEAARKGPVIIVNINFRRSDAIVVHPELPPSVVPLPLATPDDVARLGGVLGPDPGKADEYRTIEMLRELWRSIVRPVADHLVGPPHFLPIPCRIWWCPVGEASKLPLHTAGPFEVNKSNLYDMFASSYTPTLSALIHARRPKSQDTPQPKLLVVAQANTPNMKSIPHVHTERACIVKYAPHANVLEDAAGTRDAVLRGIAESSWVHLACHGTHNRFSPFLSHFSVHDGAISLLDLVKADLPHAEVAFLSACHSARVSQDLPDEFLHPAGVLLFAGFRSVVGSMWAVADEVGPIVAENFYKRTWGGDGSRRDATKVASAMRSVTAKLEGIREVPFAQAINLVHFGA